MAGDTRADRHRRRASEDRSGLGVKLGPGVDWTPPRSHRVPALVVSLLLTTGLAALLAATLAPPAVPIRQAPRPLVLRAVPGAIALTPPAPALVRPRAFAPATPDLVPPPVVRIARSAPITPPASARASVPAPVPAATSAPSISRPVLPTSPAPGDPHALDTLEARIRSAVQAALRYPGEARADGASRRALVAFDYRDRVVTDVRLLVGSNDPVLDAAALRTVREAAYPPPGTLAGRTLALAVWVRFGNGGS